MPDETELREEREVLLSTIDMHREGIAKCEERLQEIESALAKLTQSDLPLFPEYPEY